MEFVKVTYPSVRRVNLDGGPCGETGDVLKTSAGTHDFDLGAPLDYTPSSQTIQVRNTSKLSPLIVAFLPKEIAPVVPDVVLALPPARRRKIGKRAGSAKLAKPGVVPAAKPTRKSAAKKAAAKKSPAKTKTKAPIEKAATRTTAKPSAKSGVKKLAKKVAKKGTRKSARKRT